MKIIDYLKDKRFFIIFYIVLMGFISAVAVLDASTLLSFDNIIYINAVGFLFSICYLMVGYLYHKRYYDQLVRVINEQGDIINNLPEPQTGEQTVYNRLLRHIHQQQNSIIKEQQHKIRENKEFVTAWFHGIKTPIAVSRLFLEESREYSKEELIKNLQEELDRIDLQVEQALYYSKAETFEQDYFIQQVKLDRVVRETLKKYARFFIARKIELKLEDIDVEVHTDQKWLSFIIGQLLSNSLKYTLPGGKISIRVENNQLEKILVISDNGVGIKAEDLGRVFDKGFTGYMGRREQKSTGIGLYLAKKLAGNLGHQLRVESKYGEYTKAMLNFPVNSDYYGLLR